MTAARNIEKERPIPTPDRLRKPMQELPSGVGLVTAGRAELIPRHSHLIVIGRVVSAEANARTGPLLRWLGDHARIAAPALSS